MMANIPNSTKTTMIAKQIFFQKYSLGKISFEKKIIKDIMYRTIPERPQEVNLSYQTGRLSGRWTRNSPNIIIRFLSMGTKSARHPPR
jgi:hypothetical protein